MKSTWGARLIYLPILFLFLFNGCDENCDKPLDGGNEEQHYRMYLAEGVPARIFVFDIPADTTIDSASYSFSTEWLALNTDYSKILLNNRIDVNTAVIDAYTLQIDTTLPWYGYFHFDRGRNIGLIVESATIIKIDGTTLDQIGSLSLQVQEGTLDTLIGRLYANSLEAGKEHVVYEIDYQSMLIVDSILIIDTNSSPIPVRTLLAVPEASRIFFIGAGPGIYVYDTDTNKVLFRAPLSTVNGHFAINPDRTRAYMSDPGNDFFDIPGSKFIWVFDVETGLLIDYMSVRVPDSDYFFGYLDVPVLYMDFTPDGNHLYANGGFLSGYPMLHYDLSEGAIINTIDPYAGQSQPFYLLSFKFGDIIE